VTIQTKGRGEGTSGREISGTPPSVGQPETNPRILTHSSSSSSSGSSSSGSSSENSESEGSDDDRERDQRNQDAKSKSG